MCMRCRYHEPCPDGVHSFVPVKKCRSRRPGVEEAIPPRFMGMFPSVIGAIGSLCRMSGVDDMAGM